MTLTGGLILLVWLAVTTVFLADGQILIAMLGGGFGSDLRQWLCAAPLLVGPALLLLTPWWPWVVAAWAAALVIRLAGHLALQRTVARRCRLAPGALTERVAALARRWGTPAPHRVLVGEGGPAMVGLRRQALILPAGCEDGEDFEAAVAHELAHLRRRDTLRLWLLAVAVAPLAWHPLARQNAARLRLELELEADAVAAVWLRSTRAYALALGRWALRQGGAPAWGAPMAHEPADLVVRLEALAGDRASVCQARLDGFVQRQVRRLGKREHPARLMGRRYGLLLVSLLTFGYVAVFQGALWFL